jgi:hypothetical protein
MSAAGAGAADEALLPAAARGAVFDLDGTILDTMHHHWEAWSQTAGEYGCAAAARPPARPPPLAPPPRGPLRPPAAGR